MSLTVSQDSHKTRWTLGSYNRINMFEDGRIKVRMCACLAPEQRLRSRQPKYALVLVALYTELRRVTVQVKHRAKNANEKRPRLSGACHTSISCRLLRRRQKRPSTRSWLAYGAQSTRQRAHGTCLELHSACDVTTGIILASFALSHLLSPAADQVIHATCHPSCEVRTEAVKLIYPAEHLQFRQCANESHNKRTFHGRRAHFCNAARRLDGRWRRRIAH
eukprot:365990-Chlamydomonas_euryale.AAC.24